MIDFRFRFTFGKLVDLRPQNFGKLVNGGGRTTIRVGAGKDLKN